MGAQLDAEKYHLEAIIFDQSLNAIVFDLVGYSGYLQDIGRGASSGIELIADYRITQALEAVQTIPTMRRIVRMVVKD